MIIIRTNHDVPTSYLYFWSERLIKKAEPVIESSNCIVEELLKGKTVSEAIEKSHEKSNKYILELVYSKEPLAPASLQAVVANDASLGFHGDASATIC